MTAGAFCFTMWDMSEPYRRAPQSPDIIAWLNQQYGLYYSAELDAQGMYPHFAQPVECEHEPYLAKYKLVKSGLKEDIITESMRLSSEWTAANYKRLGIEIYEHKVDEHDR
jgi:hypothetical protein